MSAAGYGRGYYGVGQLETPRAPPRRGTSGWVKLAIVAGVGAVVWFMWPKREKFEGVPVFEPERGVPPPVPTLPPSSLPALPPSSLPIDPPTLELVARERGYATVPAFEDSVVATARQLRGTGANVTLAPHLQHLTARVEAP